MEISTTPEPNVQKEQKETKDPIYSNKISLEEYNKQKDDFTQKALKELSEQMKTFEKPKENKEENKTSKSAFNIINTNKKINTNIINVDDNNDNDNDDDNNNDNDDNDGSESDYDTNLDNTKPSKSSINLIVQHVENKQKKRKVSHTQSKTQDTSMSDSIYAQHEVDMRTIQLLKDKINDLKIENADLDSKKHYLTLDLNNAQCDVNEMKKQVSYLKDQLIAHKQFIKQMKKCDDDFAKMLKSVGICILLFISFYIKFLIF
jgi:hypothetical protein